ncbi:hypothetical protein AC739_19120 [Planococcus glaciei]|nr:hypothetical protein AC739_19120 [Planococcus glaciei]
MNSNFINIRKNGEITLPNAFRKAIGLSENDQLAIAVQDGQIILQPVSTIPEDQLWFWTQEWQEGELEADQDIIHGRVHHFTNIEDAIKFLNDKEE